MLDVLIRNARIVDGSGNPGSKGDLAVERDRIAAIGRFPDAQAKLTIDAAARCSVPASSTSIAIRRSKCWLAATQPASRWALPRN